MANRQLLRNAFPKWYEGGGIFAKMQDPPWVDDIDGVTLDTAYFGNRSGYKFCAPIIYNFLDEKGVITSEGQSAIARIILARYSKPWARLWSLMKSEYDPLDNYSVSEEIDMTTHASGQDKSNGTSKDTGSLTTSHTGTDTNKSTGTEGVERTGQNTSKDITDGATSGAGGRYGFNSANSQPTTTSSASTKTTLNHVEIPNEKTNRTPDLTDQRTLALEDKDVHDLSVEANSTVERDNTTTDKGTRKRAGITGLISRQRLIEQEREAWQWDFFESVFTDVDKVLALSVYDPCVMEQFDYTGGGTSGGYVLPVATNTNLGGVRAPSKTNGTVRVQVDSSGYLYVPDASISFASSETLGGIKLPSDPVGDGEEISTKNGVQFLVDKTLSPEGSYKNDDTISVVIPYAGADSAGLVKGPLKTNETQQVAVSSDGTMWVPQSTGGGGGGAREIVDLGTIHPKLTLAGLDFSGLIDLTTNLGKTLKFTFDAYTIYLDVDELGEDYIIGHNFRWSAPLPVPPNFTMYCIFYKTLSLTSIWMLQKACQNCASGAKIAEDGYCKVNPVWSSTSVLGLTGSRVDLITDGKYVFTHSGEVLVNPSGSEPISKLTKTIDGTAIRYSKPTS